MKKTLLFVLFFISIAFLSYSQTDYSNVQFKSYIYKYKESAPRTTELGIDKQLLIDIIELLSTNQYTEAKKNEIAYKTWLAMTNPKKFDYVFRDFSISSNTDWGVKNAKGELVLEPNPYLTNWTVSDNEYPYFQITLNKILEYFKLMTYGDDAESVASSFNKLLITKDFKFHSPKEDDWAYSYIETVNTQLEKKGLVALVTKGHYNIIVCDIKNKQKITNLFEKLHWDLVQP